MVLVPRVSQYLLGQTEDLLPSAVTLLMAFPVKTQKNRVIFQIYFIFYIIFAEIQTGKVL